MQVRNNAAVKILGFIQNVSEVALIGKKFSRRLA